MVALKGAWHCLWGWVETTMEWIKIAAMSLTVMVVVDLDKRVRKIRR